MSSFSAQFGAVGPRGIRKRQGLYSSMVQSCAQQGLATQQVLAKKEQQRYANEQAFQEKQFEESQRQSELANEQWQSQFDADKSRWEEQYNMQKSQWEQEQEQAKSQWEENLALRQQEMQQQNSLAQQQLNMQDKQNKWQTYLGIGSTAASIFGGLGGWDAISIWF